ncbi:NADPH-dependent F420 reductase [Dyadobacter sp. MSC1_007]|jgi:predicted dinucleotide-binding enzyme|uniref:NADPH-dependent F420 reductase n=1 Tax=Dyadobacter sp. MSC1_007 TaxID=2909264 RepID=UPI002030EEA8|nr:NAD(P)-binding domain-containing protein [Dyadobacter sp. MSC1_007]
MKIGIIGTGALGGTIAKKLVAAGHKVKATNASPVSELKERAAQLGVAAASIKDVVRDVEIIIVSIPTNAIPNLPRDLFAGVPGDVIVIDTTNYYPYRDGPIENGFIDKLESIWVSRELRRPVVKAFNNLLSYTLENRAKAKGAPGRIAIAISGDDEKAKFIVSELIDELGFDPVDVGPLSESWRHQPGMPSYCTELSAPELEQALADHENIREIAPQLRDLTTDKLMARTTPPSHQEMLDAIRSLFPINPKQDDGQ